MRHPIWNNYIAPEVASIERQTVPGIPKQL